MIKLKYSLKNQSNIIENGMAPLIEAKFPNYEVFWSKYLMPLTGINLNPPNLNIRYNTHPLLEEIHMSHYAILKSINFIRVSKDTVIQGDPFQRFKNIYFHFGLILESVAHLARNILRLKESIGLFDIELKTKKTKDILKNEFDDWVEKKYDKHFNNFIDFAKPIVYHPHHRIFYIKIILNNEKLWKKYSKYESRIREYRNIFIHNPQVDILRSGGRLYSPKIETIKKYRLWTEIRKKFHDSLEDFGNSRRIIETDLDEGLMILNKIWDIFCKEMDEMYKRDDFEEYLFFDRTPS